MWRYYVGMLPTPAIISRFQQRATRSTRPSDLTQGWWCNLPRVLLILVLFISRTTADEPKTDDQISAKHLAWFEKNIRPLLISKCYSCHSAKDQKIEGGLTLDTKRGWQTGGDQGPAIVPGDPDASLLIRAIRYGDTNLEMPPDRKLTARQIKLLEDWVKLGAPDPRTKPLQQPVTNNPADPIKGRSHWSFQPLKVTQPDIELDEKEQEWIQSPIDAYVSQKLKAKNLSPNKIAERRSLAKRAYVALIGILPTPDQLDQFISDSRSEAYERLVDRLLASPQFGERWGRHWLDLARYADSNGLDENFLFREAWRYRNWVIQSLNEDLPFDRFSLEQIAGDLLPFDSIEQRDRQRIASGFLVIGPKVLLGVNGELQKMDVADELIDTVGRTFLGQTLGCARCHDHKFDPIPTKDYYALAGIFTSTEVMQTRYMLGQQRKMERLLGIGSEEDKLNQAYEKYWRERGKLKQQLDQSRKALELLKKNETKLADVIKKFPRGVAEILKTGKKSPQKKSLQKETNRTKPVPKTTSPVVADRSNRVPQSKTKTPQVSPDPEFTRAEMVSLQQAFVQSLAKRYSTPPAIPARAMVATDKSSPQNEFIRIAGQFNRKGAQVSRGFLSVLTSGSTNIPQNQSGRVELAKWLFDLEQGAGHLTARVLANRVWHHMIGQGLVKQTDLFGRTGKPPSHPELLDYLAQQIVESDWSVKKLIREIALSSTFQQSSQHSALGNDIDPDNRLLWRANRRRLSPEAFRDSILSAASELDSRSLDSSVNYLGDQATAVGANKNRRRTDFKNRSIYLPIIRNDLPELFEAFDFADPHRTTGSRPQTTAAKTGLYILNDPQMMNASKQLAERALSRSGISDRDRIHWLYERILHQSPTPAEVKQVIEFVDTLRNIERRKLSSRSELPPQKSRPTEREIQLKAWSAVCHALFASSRFQLLE